MSGDLRSQADIRQARNHAPRSGAVRRTNQNSDSRSVTQPPVSYPGARLNSKCTCSRLATAVFQFHEDHLRRDCCLVLRVMRSWLGYHNLPMFEIGWPRSSIGQVEDEA